VGVSGREQWNPTSPRKKRGEIWGTRFRGGAKENRRPLRCAVFEMTKLWWRLGMIFPWRTGCRDPQLCHLELRACLWQVKDGMNVAFRLYPGHGSMGAPYLARLLARCGIPQPSPDPRPKSHRGPVEILFIRTGAQRSGEICGFASRTNYVVERMEIADGNAP
jgi:hypothetical protein